MGYKNLNTFIILKLIVFAATISTIVWSLQSDKWFYFMPILTIAIMVEIYDFIKYVNGINRKLAYFFDAVKNEDTTLKFPVNTRNKSLNMLHQSLNGVNKMIADIKIKNENNEKFLSELINYSTTGLISLDSKGYIININESAQNHLKIPNITNISILKQKKRDLYDILTSIKPYERKSIKITSGEEIKHLLIQSSVIKFKREEFKLFSVQDIKREIDENELDSWQKLIRVMTHEIMNSIAPITSLSNTLSQFYQKEGKIKKPEELNHQIISNTIDGLSIIKEQSKGLTHFVESYRKLAKIPQPSFKEIRVNEWIKSVALLFKPSLDEKGIKLKLTMDKNMSSIFSDEKLLNQVLINIIKNGIQSMEKSYNKELSISITSGSDNKRTIKICDTGCGMNSELLDKIFIPFFTTKENGDGIGLSLSRQIMRRLKGSLTATSTEGKGSEFVMVF